MQALLLCSAMLAADYTIDGTVQAVDPAAGTITIKRDNGKITTVDVSKAEMRRDAKLCKIDAIKVGQECRCVYDPDTGKASHFGVYVELDRPAKRP